MSLVETTDQPQQQKGVVRQDELQTTINELELRKLAQGLLIEADQGVS